MDDETWNKEVRYVKGVGPKRAERLAHLGLETVEDVLFYLPHRYEVRKPVPTISKVRPGEEQIVEGEVHGISKRRSQSGTDMVEAEVMDRTGRIAVTWFHMPYLADKFEEGDEVQLAGEVEVMGGNIQMTHPDFRLMSEEEDREALRTIEPVYSVTEGIGQTLMKKIVRNSYEEVKDDLSSVLPEELRQQEHIQSLPEAIRSVHFPESEQEADKGRQSLYYFQALCFFLIVEEYRRQLKQQAITGEMLVGDTLDRRIRDRFPFSFTDAQERVVREIREDYRSGTSMYRLLQGDVGSGKTVVALYAMLVAIAHGYQTCFMAPTSVLARQHYQTIGQYLHDSEVQFELLTGAVKGERRSEIYQDLREGNLDIIVGTHALIEEEVTFRNLAVAVIDEQQRFGVRHRSRLLEKGESPHVLVTTATPIPRTLALTLYGDLDLSILDEMPPGRKPVVTALRKRAKLPEICQFIRGRVRAGEQAFFVYPMIEESEEVPMTSAEEMYQKLTEDVFPDIGVALLHGRMSEQKKRTIMEQFHQGEIQILVSTVVIEVGVDVPNATMMVIDHAERYGLAQLHQLRGRIGRGKKQSYCVLLSDRTGGKARERMEIFTSTDDGFEIAEEDLRLRGPGAILGTEQSGAPVQDLFEIGKHPEIIRRARQDAGKIQEVSPDLTVYSELRKAVERRKEETIRFLRSG